VYKLIVLVGLPVLFLSFFDADVLSQGGQNQSEPEEVLNYLRAIDSTYLNAIRIQATLTSSASKKKSALVEFTCSGNECALSEKWGPPGYVSLGPPRIGAMVQLDSNSKSRIQGQAEYDSNGNRVFLSSDDKNIILFDETKQVRIATTARYLISPEDKVLDRTELNSSVLYFPRNPSDLAFPNSGSCGALDAAIHPFSKGPKARNCFLMETCD